MQDDSVSLHRVVKILLSLCSVTVGNEYAVVDLDETAAGIDLDSEIGTVEEHAVADNVISGNGGIGVHQLMLNLLALVVDHTACIHAFRAAGLRICRIVIVICILKARVEHDSVNDESTADLIAEVVVDEELELPVALLIAFAAAFFAAFAAF